MIDKLFSDFSCADSAARHFRFPISPCESLWQKATLLEDVSYYSNNGFEHDDFISYYDNLFPVSARKFYSGIDSRKLIEQGRLECVVDSMSLDLYSSYTKYVLMVSSDTLFVNCIQCAIEKSSGLVIGKVQDVYVYVPSDGVMMLSDFRPDYGSDFAGGE